MKKEMDFTDRELDRIIEMAREDRTPFDAILDHDDQKLFDYIFKGESIGIESHEIFIDMYLKNFTQQGNF